MGLKFSPNFASPRFSRNGSQSFRWEHLARRDFLEATAKSVTLVLGLACVALIALTAKSSIETRLNAAALLNKLETISTNARPVEPPKPVEGTDFSVIASRSIFGPLTQITNTRPAAPVVVAKDPLTLIGTFVTAGEPPYAIIEDDKKKLQDVFGVGEPLFGDGKVKKIMVDRVEIERGGQTETLVLDIDSAGSDDGGSSSGANSDLVVVPETEYTQALDNLPLLLTQARAVPYFKDGKPQGLRLFAVKAGSFYERLGLKNGDVLKTINGNSLADLSQAMQLLEKLRTERSFSIAVERNSEPRDLRYEIR